MEKETQEEKSQKEVLKIHGLLKTECIMLWSALGLIAVYVNLNKGFQPGAWHWQEVQSFNLILLAAGGFFTALLWLSDFIFGEPIFFDGMLFWIGDMLNGDNFTEKHIESYSTENLSQPPRAKLRLKNGRIINVLPPMWLLKAKNKEEFIHAVHNRYRKNTAT